MAFTPKSLQLAGFDKTDSDIPTAAADPSSAVDGQQYINTVTNEFKIYFCGSWQTVFTFTCSVINYFFLNEDGSGGHFTLEDGTGSLLLN